MRIPILLTALAMTLPVAVERTSADEQQGRARGQAQPTGQMRFRAMDANNDGQISPTEWRGSAQSFRVHDWNNDGVLSGEEVRQVLRQLNTADPWDWDLNDTYNDWSEQRFTALDRNRDGRLTAAEWTYDIDSFRRADRNRDNILTRAEFINTDFDDDRGDRFDFLDEDGNNRITRAEWHGSDQAFTWMDRNRDGWLSRTEVEGTAAPTNTDTFARLDSNRDGRVARTEWLYTRASFDRLDTNNDGVLTRREMAGTDVNDTSTAATVSVGGTSNETRWTDTGVYVYGGDMVSFRALGTIYMMEGNTDPADPRGSRTGRHANDSPMPDQLAGALIGRVENGAPFLIGNRTAAIGMPRTGRLFLSVNDDHLGDNHGAFNVTVQATRAR